MLDAIAAGDVFLSPFIAAEGQKPGCDIAVTGFGIPVGAKNPEAAQDYINWLMTDPAQNADWVLRPGGGFPVLKSTQAAEQFQTPFYKEAGEVLSRSECHPWQGSLERPAEAQKLGMGGRLQADQGRPDCRHRHRAAEGAGRVQRRQLARGERLS